MDEILTTCIEIIDLWQTLISDLCIHNIRRHFVYIQQVLIIS